MFPNLLLSSFFFPRVPRARPGAAASQWGGLAGPGTGVARAARVLLLLPPAGARWRRGWVKTVTQNTRVSGLKWLTGTPKPLQWGANRDWGGGHPSLYRAISKGSPGGSPLWQQSWGDSNRNCAGATGSPLCLGTRRQRQGRGKRTPP